MSRFILCLLLLQRCVAAAPALGALLTFVEAQVDGQNGVQGLAQASAVVVSPDGKHVYAASPADAAVAGFDRDASTGHLAFFGAQRNGQQGVQGLGGAAALALSPDGLHLYAAGKTDGAVAVFARNAATGELTFVQAHTTGAHNVVGLAGANSLAVSPDGRNLYVTGQTDGALVAFDRDTGTGALTFADAYVNGVDGVDWLNGVTAVAVSPDGADVYVAAYDPSVPPGGQRKSVVTMLRRSSPTGSLSFNGELVQGVNGIDGVTRPNALAMAAIGTHLYVSSVDQDVTVLARDAATGLLAFVQNANVVDGGPKALTVSPDGERVYVASRFSGSASRSLLTVLPRAADGTVTFGEAYADGEPAGVTGLNGATAVAVSQDNRHVYVAGQLDNALAVFASRSGEGTPTVSPLPTSTPPPSPPATSTPTASPTMSPTQPTAVCVGDCGHDDAVTVNELLIMVNVALGITDVGACPPGDASHDGMITVDEILKAVNNALAEC